VPKLDKVVDEDLRRRLSDANASLRANQPTEAVRALADTFVWMLRTHPELMAATEPVRGGRQVPVVLRWPALGANLDPASVRSGEPTIQFTRDRFAMSEAITYFEFTVDTAVSHGL
jgi:hypothetical protein